MSLSYSSSQVTGFILEDRLQDAGVVDNKLCFIDTMGQMHTSLKEIVTVCTRPVYKLKPDTISME